MFRIVLAFCLLASFKSLAAVDIKKKDLQKIPSLLPTMYHMAVESKTKCKGKYRGDYYTGKERKEIKDVEGKVIKTVCSRFYWILLMEGSGWLDKGEGETIVVNYDKDVGEKDYRFYVIPQDGCIYGEGIERNLCLIPYHTIAADLKKHKIGDIIYIPRAKGLTMPDGKKHNGLFVVRDTGGAFINIGKQRVDLYVGTEVDINNTFSRAGFHHRKKEKAFKLKGASKTKAEAWFAKTFPDMW